ncbi:MAG TPA: response regulator [Thermoanaerobaculia bacterium]|nr:response regulator [Thermoanaerobaculia bacterium]
MLTESPPATAASFVETSSPSEQPAEREGDGLPAVEAPDILVVDDDATNLAAIEVALGELGSRLVKADSGRSALRRLLEQDFAVILLDVQMPGMDGFETARLIRQRSRTRHTPIIFVTAYSRDDADILRGYALGAVDFLFKPIVPEVLRAKASVFVELQQRTAEVRRQAELLRQLERREAERKLAIERQRWEAEALREENRRKDEFLALLAHELRNPLSPIVTGLELFRQAGMENPALQRVHASMERQARHLVRLVDDLLDVSRISQGKIELQLERLELSPLLRQAVDSVRPLIEERRHRLVFEEADRDLVVEADAVRLVQVIANLLNNAARYTDPGGEIRLSVARDEDDALVRVADTGRGIAPEMLDRIFDIFVQEREGGKGLGLGLTLVRQLVELHGGGVRAFSQGPGQGSELVVRLPLAEPAAGEGDAAAPGAEEDEEAEAVSVVLVDDEEDIREAMSALLESWGMEVRVAEDGGRGLELIFERPPDVALVDIAMPGVDGYAVARRVRSRMRDGAPRLVALTGFGREEDRRRALDAGFDAHLIKPAAPRDLRRALRRGTTHG